MPRCRSSSWGGGPAFGPCWVMPSWGRRCSCWHGGNSLHSRARARHTNGRNNGGGGQKCDVFGAMCSLIMDCGNYFSNVFTDNVFLFQMQNGWLYVSRSEFFRPTSQLSVAVDSINSRVVMILSNTKLLMMRAIHSTYLDLECLMLDAILPLGLIFLFRHQMLSI